MQSGQREKGVNRRRLDPLPAGLTGLTNRGAPTGLTNRGAQSGLTNRGALSGLTNRGALTGLTNRGALTGLTNRGALTSEGAGPFHDQDHLKYRSHY